MKILRCYVGLPAAPFLAGWIRIIMQLMELSWPKVKALPRSTPIVIPVAAVEQHGHHLPVSTDSLLLGEVTRRAAEQVGDQVLWFPLQWLGNSHHHLDFPGTLSADPRGYLNLLRDLAENFIAHGFQRIVFVNGHGGNITPGKQAVFELRQKYRDRGDLLLLFATYWEHGDPRATSSEFVQTQMGHACEWETSMILRLRPELVGPITDLPPVTFDYGFEPAYRGWTTKDRTEVGYIGQPAKATAEKGEHLFQTFGAGVSDLLKKVAAWDGKSWPSRS